MKKVFWIFIGFFYNIIFVDLIDKNILKYIKSFFF